MYRNKSMEADCFKAVDMDEVVDRHSGAVEWGVDQRPSCLDSGDRYSCNCPAFVWPGWARWGQEEASKLYRKRRKMRKKYQEKCLYVMPNTIYFHSRLSKTYTSDNTQKQHSYNEKMQIIIQKLSLIRSISKSLIHDMHLCTIHVVDKVCQKCTSWLLLTNCDSKCLLLFWLHVQTGVCVRVRASVQASVSMYM